MLTPATAGDFALALDKLLKGKKKSGELAPRTLNHTGARPGEAFGARKANVDLEHGTWRICRSWDQDEPKDDDWREVVIVPELRPYLTEAFAASRSERVFSRPDGTPYEPSIRHALVDRLRRALGRAGIVDGYRQVPPDGVRLRRGAGGRHRGPLPTVLHAALGYRDPEAAPLV